MAGPGFNKVVERLTEAENLRAAGLTGRAIPDAFIRLGLRTPFRRFIGVGVLVLPLSVIAYSSEIRNEKIPKGTPFLWKLAAPSLVLGGVAALFF